MKNSDEKQTQVGSTRRINAIAQRHASLSKRDRTAAFEARWENVDSKDLVLAIAVQMVDSTVSLPMLAEAEIDSLIILNVTFCMNEETPLSEERMQR